jgi:hypothetical protein
MALEKGTAIRLRTAHASDPSEDPMTIDMDDGWPQDPRRLREIATWYGEFAERTGNPTIWEGRLRTAMELEKVAARLAEAPGRHRSARHVDCDY